MIKSISLVRAASKKGSEYNCLEFDIGYRSIKVFADSQTLMSLSGLNPEDYYNLKVSDKIVLFEQSK